MERNAEFRGSPWDQSMAPAGYASGDEMRSDMSEHHAAARREMRRLLLASGDNEMKDAYYRTVTLAEHEARRAALKRVDDYGLALMMIREGCDDPKGVAADALRKYEQGSAAVGQ